MLLDLSKASADANVGQTAVATAPNRLDAPLLALASELEAVARPYLTYDRDAEVTSADPDCKEARETGRRLYEGVKAVADRIFAHQPESLAGLLVQAHAAALTCSDAWEENPDNGGQDGQLLRLVCNGLFRLAGVDWRGKAIEGSPRPRPDGAPAEATGDDAFLALAPTILPMLDHFDSLWKPCREAYKVVEADAEALKLEFGSCELQRLSSWRTYLKVREPADALVCKILEFIDLHMDRHSTTLDGLLLKQRIGRSLEQYQEDPGIDLDAMVSARLAAGEPLVGNRPLQPMSCEKIAAADATLIPLAEAAIAEERTASAIAEATEHDSPPGTFARSMQLLELVAATDAATPAGLAAKARLLLTHTPEPDDLDGDWRCAALALSIAQDAVRLSAAE